MTVEEYVELLCCLKDAQEQLLFAWAKLRKAERLAREDEKAWRLLEPLLLQTTRPEVFRSLLETLEHRLHLDCVNKDVP